MTVRLPILAEPTTLADSFERRITYLRVSLTDRCNFRCAYCMPEEGVALMPREDVLSFEEIERLARVFARLGVRRLRLTGGEPTVRKDVIELVERLAKVRPALELVMTTNGSRLVELAAPLRRAGLSGVNVSLDTLDPRRFHMITRRGDLQPVLEGIEHARLAGLRLKMNIVALRELNGDEIGPLCDYAWQRDIIPRFIEWMPMSDGDLYQPASALTAAEIRDAVRLYTDQPLVAEMRGAPITGPARYWRVAGTSHLLGIISAISEHFCADCNRVRLTAAGQLHTCLAYDDAVDLRQILRQGGSDEDVVHAIAVGVGAKRAGHQFSCTGGGAPHKHMVAIGG